LIGVEGEPIGIVSLAAANKMAEDAELDLVEIAPTAVPPVCRIMDYGKFKYRESKKRHEAKLKQKQIVVKEVKFRPGTDEGDYKIKLRNLIRFLEEGDKTKITLRYRGRELAHQEFGIRLLERVRGDLEPFGVVEQWPKMEGRQLVMVLAPKVKPVAAKPAKPKSADDRPAGEKPARKAKPAEDKLVGDKPPAEKPDPTDAVAASTEKEPAEKVSTEEPLAEEAAPAKEAAPASEAAATAEEKK
jgi:translation initiation factor IF-3